MCLPYTDLFTIDFTVRPGNDSEMVIEQLFDKLFKKALTHVLENTIAYHCDNLKCWSVGAAFPERDGPSGRTKKQSTLL